MVLEAKLILRVTCNKYQGLRLTRESAYSKCSPEKVSRVEGNDLPEVLREIGFESSAATDFSKSSREIEPRRQFLVAVGCMAAETLKFGFYDKKGCAHDIDAMKPNILTGDEIKGLIEIAQLMLLPNLSIFNYVKEQLCQWLNISGAAPVLGDKFNQRFLEKGTKVEITQHLDRVLPLD